MAAALPAGLLHAQSLGWHDVLWGLGFIAAVALAYWLVHAWRRRPG
jgi:hypothetical protein